jgi:hypothetical protein
VIDDYGCFEACRSAVENYRAVHGIVAPIERIDWGGVFWQKPLDEARSWLYRYDRHRTHEAAHDDALDD